MKPFTIVFPTTFYLSWSGFRHISYMLFSFEHWRLSVKADFDIPQICLTTRPSFFSFFCGLRANPSTVVRSFGTVERVALQCRQRHRREPKGYGWFIFERQSVQSAFSKLSRAHNATVPARKWWRKKVSFVQHCSRGSFFAQRTYGLSLENKRASL